MMKRPTSLIELVVPCQARICVLLNQKPNVAYMEATTVMLIKVRQSSWTCALPGWVRSSRSSTSSKSTSSTRDSLREAREPVSICPSRSWPSRVWSPPLNRGVCQSSGVPTRVLKSQHMSFFRIPTKSQST